MKQILSFFFCLLSGVVIAQNVNWKKLESLTPDRMLWSGSRKPTKVLLLGTFHFAYPQADAHKTDSSKFIDVLSEKRQQELQELADVIKRFAPTRIYIESTRPGFHDSLYTAYREGTFIPGRNEVYQVGYRVAKQMNLPKLYAVDAGSFVQENAKKYPAIDSMWNSSTMVNANRDQYWQKMYTQFYDAGDSVATSLTMLENFLLMAEASTLYRMHGHYLSAGFNTTTDNGPDMLAMWWYSRNLRIFNNILRTEPSSEDRIVVLFGNGHLPILKHCFQSSPEFEVVELKSLVK